jgi:hypothetical protein
MVLIALFLLWIFTGYIGTIIQVANMNEFDRNFKTIFYLVLIATIFGPLNLLAVFKS